MSSENQVSTYLVGHTGLQAESLQVTISKLPRGSLAFTMGDFLCTGDIQLMSQSSLLVGIEPGTSSTRDITLATELPRLATSRDNTASESCYLVNTVQPHCV